MLSFGSSLYIIYSRYESAVVGYPSICWCSDCGAQVGLALYFTVTSGDGSGSPALCGC